MNNMTLFTNTDALKESGIIDDNIQEKDILVSIRKVQSTRLQSILGTNLYDRVVYEIEDNKISDEILILLNNYLFDTIAYLVKADLQLELSFRTRSTGLQSTNDESKTNSYLSEIKYIKQYNENTAQFYINRLVDFLKAYKDKYPEYQTIRDNSDMKPDNSFNTGFNL